LVEFHIRNAINGRSEFLSAANELYDSLAFSCSCALSDAFFHAPDDYFAHFSCSFIVLVPAVCVSCADDPIRESADALGLRHSLSVCEVCLDAID
jgi:hypothetical protein